MTASARLRRLRTALTRRRPPTPDPVPEPTPDPPPTPPPPTPPPPPPDPAPAPPEPPKWLELIGTVGSFLSLFTAVLFYFGWASTDAETRALGLRDTLFRFSTADYLLRSVDALYLPVLGVAAAALAATALHQRAERDAARAAPVLRWLRHAWVPALLVVPLYSVAPGVLTLVIPLVVLLGVLLAAYARTRPEPDGPPPPHRRRIWVPALLVALVALFWAVYAYAGIVGRGRAALTTATVASEFPAVVVFSERDLLIRGGGSCVSAVDEKGSPYRFRYAGLRLFHVSGDRLFLVPRHWAPSDGTLYVLREDEAEVRVEYVSGGVEYRERECDEALTTP
ncbi:MULTISPECIES: hypothetical protein [unclassified Streptomyces]|uniref:hypothetical protein n=1 Tax=unclassified Streptomyces TaxID=2593676 RepID=UPI000A9FBED7|nr:hypothetical protein [Streptomyces sp. TSRI0107]